MNNAPYQQQGNSVGITAASSPPTGVQIPVFSGSTIQPMQFRIKIGYDAASDVAVGWGATAAEAQTNAALPGGSSAKCHVMGANQTEVLTHPPGTFWSAYVASGSPKVYISCGDGL